MKTSTVIKAQAARAERVFLNANPGWTVLKWTAPLEKQFNKAESMLSGKFDARGPAGTTRNVWVSVYADGIRIF